jgi:hypothetical protein
MTDISPMRHTYISYTLMLTCCPPPLRPSLAHPPCMQVAELTMQTEYQLRLKDLHLQERVKELTEKFTTELENDRQKFELLLQEKNEQEMEYEEKLKQAEERSQAQLSALDTQYQVGGWVGGWGMGWGKEWYGMDGWMRGGREHWASLLFLEVTLPLLSCLPTIPLSHPFPCASWSLSHTPSSTPSHTLPCTGQDHGRGRAVPAADAGEGAAERALGRAELAAGRVARARDCRADRGL